MSPLPCFVPLPRFRILVNEVDADAADAATAPMAEFTFFGPHGGAVVGKEAVMLVANSRGQASYVPPELTGLVGKKFLVAVAPHGKSLDADYRWYQVQATKPLHDELPIPPAPAADEASGSGSMHSHPDPYNIATPPLSVEMTPQFVVLPTPQATERSSTAIDTTKRAGSQITQSKQKKGRAANELQYPTEE